jgi:hypothetical protein
MKTSAVSTAQADPYVSPSRPPPNYTRMLWTGHNFLHLSAVGAVLLFSGCVNRPATKQQSNVYELTIGFIGLNGSVINTVVITTNPGVPFELRTEDAEGNQYRMSGHLGQNTANNFSLETVSVGLQMSNHSSFSANGPSHLELGQKLGVRAVGGVLLNGCSFLLTRK